MKYIDCPAVGAYCRKELLRLDMFRPRDGRTDSSVTAKDMSPHG